MKTWTVTGCKPPSYVLDNGEPVPCCGCPLGTIAQGRAIPDCTCRCHDSADFLASWQRPAQPGLFGGVA